MEIIHDGEIETETELFTGPHTCGFGGPCGGQYCYLWNGVVNYNTDL